jgi:hypothetical protein
MPVVEMTIEKMAGDKMPVVYMKWLENICMFTNVLDKIRVDQMHLDKMLVEKLPLDKISGDTITLVKMSGDKNACETKLL